MSHATLVLCPCPCWEEFIIMIFQQCVGTQKTKLQKTKLSSPPNLTLSSQLKDQVSLRFPTRRTMFCSRVPLRLLTKYLDWLIYARTTDVHYSMHEQYVFTPHSCADRGPRPKVQQIQCVTTLCSSYGAPFMSSHVVKGAVQLPCASLVRALTHSGCLARDVLIS